MAITIDDFSKIWASTSPLTPYSFSDSNYQEGWNFVGNTPPSRQMWDFLQKNNDEKLKYLLDNFNDYLPLSGGTMTGAIKGNPITLTADDGNGNTKSFVANADGTLTWDGKAVIVGTEATETFDNVSVGANASVNVGTLAHVPKYYSIFAGGSGFADCSFIMSASGSVWCRNHTSVARTLGITVNYIY